jgi:uroporphyrinogen decarboxylase
MPGERAEGVREDPTAMPKTDLSSRERFLAACRREPVDGPPGWVMRQAGRYLPEYRALRGGHPFMEMVETPELALEVTLQPIRRFDMDAAVIFSDILVPAKAMGLSVEFHEGKGPVLEPALRGADPADALRDFDPAADTPFVAELVRRVRAELPDKAVIGFCGAPWTLASYLVEGGSSRNFEHAKALLYGNPDGFSALCARLVDNLIPYLAMQVEAGADVLQVFDSWGGALDAATYAEHVLPHVTRLVAGAKRTGVPVILYVNGAVALLECMARSGADVLGIDWRVAPAEALARAKGRCALQGNLDPCMLFAPADVVARETAATLDAFTDADGYIFNLGSGILPGTPVESMEAVFRTLRARRPGASS